MNRFTLRLVVAAASLIAMRPIVQAQFGTIPQIGGTPQVFVSTTGVDANACSESNPCRTLARAINAVKVGGVVVILNSGNYGRVTITHSVTIESTSGSSLVFTDVGPTGTSGITIDAGDDVVTLRGLKLNYVPGLFVTSASGIEVKSGAALITDLVINGFPKSGILINTHGKVLVDRCRLENNGIGLEARSTSKVSMFSSVVAGNGTGISWSWAPAASLYLDKCVIALSARAFDVSYLGAPSGPTRGGDGSEGIFASDTVFQGNFAFANAVVNIRTFGNLRGDNVFPPDTLHQYKIQTWTPE